MSFHTKQHRLCILPPSGAPTHYSITRAKALCQLTEIISHQNDNVTETNKLMQDNISWLREKEETKKDILKKLHPSSLEMLKMTSSTDGDNAADNIVQTCKDFFNCKSAGLADQTLCFQF
eukprot:13358305-Ditylum_brightwellii.AAC.1